MEWISTKDRLPDDGVYVLAKHNRVDANTKVTTRKEGTMKEQLTEAGTATKRWLIHLIRTKCLYCCCNDRAEVRECGIQGCSLWQHRLGNMKPIPFTDPNMIA